MIIRIIFQVLMMCLMPSNRWLIMLKKGLSLVEMMNIYCKSKRKFPQCITVFQRRMIFKHKMSPKQKKVLNLMCLLEIRITIHLPFRCMETIMCYALSVIAICHYEGIPVEDIKKLKTFQGVKRRFTDKQVGNQIIV